MHADAIKTVREPRKIEKLKRVKVHDKSELELNDGPHIFDWEDILTAKGYVNTSAEMQESCQRSRNLLDEGVRSLQRSGASVGQHGSEDVRECVIG